MNFFHGEEDLARRVGSDVVDRHHVGVVELSGDLGFAQEPKLGAAFRLRGVGDFERHGAVHFSVEDRDHHAVSAFAEHVLLPVSVMNAGVFGFRLFHAVGEGRFGAFGGQRDLLGRLGRFRQVQGGVVVRRDWRVVVAAHFRTP